MTEKEREAYLGDQKWFECIKPITNVRKGSGCEVGKSIGLSCVMFAMKTIIIQASSSTAS